MALVTVTFQSSVTPEIAITESDILGGVPGSAPGVGQPGGAPPAFGAGRFLARLLMSIFRPKATVDSPIGKTVAAPGGEPFPWQVGLPLLLLGVGALSVALYSLVRRMFK